MLVVDEQQAVPLVLELGACHHVMCPPAPNGPSPLVCNLQMSLLGDLLVGKMLDLKMVPKTVLLKDAGMDPMLVLLKGAGMALKMALMTSCLEACLFSGQLVSFCFRRERRKLSLKLARRLVPSFYLSVSES